MLSFHGNEFEIFTAVCLLFLLITLIYRFHHDFNPFLAAQIVPTFGMMIFYICLASDVAWATEQRLAIFRPLFVTSILLWAFYVMNGLINKIIVKVVKWMHSGFKMLSRS